ncbi:hypothetical protein AYI70_g6978 [Smittium culicis]|uniref:Yeast cell wall synthesis Kre9/Knh1-like N-terminal domain-containing protein n=1 Tax=Smittium culicis TaxID=133412 RepID=A0A1R1XMN0_9FUNG|nr:hypothetical protein AYI70_g6978 [Smittium culicis]
MLFSAKFMILFAVLFAILSIANASLVITQPLQSSNWKPGNNAAITWMNSERSAPLGGKLIIDLMEGSDPKNLAFVLTITEDVDASKKMLQYKVPSDLPFSKSYSLRFTTELGEQSYSTLFTGGAGDKYDGQVVTGTGGDGNKNDKSTKTEKDVKDAKDVKSDKSGPQPTTSKADNKEKQNNESKSTSIPEIGSVVPNNQPNVKKEGSDNTHLLISGAASSGACIISVTFVAFLMSMLV